MVLVDSSNSFLNPFIERQQGNVGLVCRLVEGVVPRYPGIVLVMLIINGE